MSDGFDYEAPGVPETAVADVVSEIQNHGKLPPLTPEEREQRRIDAEIYLWECSRRDQERQAAYERDQAIKAEAAERQRSIEREQQLNKARLERHEQIARETRERELRSLRLEVTRQEWWARSVEQAARNAAIQQKRQAAVQAVYGPIIAALEQKLNPPPAMPESVEVVYVEESRDPAKLDYPELRRWFSRS